MNDKDDILIDDIEAAFRAAYRTYRRSDSVTQDQLHNNLEEAARNWISAQRKLIRDDEVATQELITKMREIKHRIDDAADTQELVIALGRLAIFLATL